MLLAFLDNLLNLFLDTAIWLLFGLILAAILKGWIPTSLVKRWLSGKGAGSVIRAAFIGAPLPLCSCGVLPTAIGLRRSGASKPATVSFLVATPETGVDSISVTYALLGPAMAVIRPISAIVSAIVSGLLIILFDRDDTHEKQSPPTKATPEKVSSCCSTKTAVASRLCCGEEEEEEEEEVSSNCCSTNKDEASSSCCSSKEKTEASGSCCGSIEEPIAASSDGCGGLQTEVKKPGILAGLQFAIVDILDDISKWLTIGLILAAVIATLVEPSSLSQWGSGLTGMLLMLIVGLPLYICATASTPLAAALLAAGMSPGAILVFLLVGPATNIASIGILSRELGVRAVIIYLCGISICAVMLGLATDIILNSQTLSVGTAMAHHDSEVFTLLKWVAAILLFVLAVKPLRQLFWRNNKAACA
ncbi:SO_0444 family Cu/Zn efflux transporter [uncultured Amphritea sp.]|uniref:SO_0444 family Cu/Zn efflux transporter n=1 Tax=uncultured Amphritea sp. TaxID=981605 RepID=UPI0026027F0D|nr:SO_0444 family Cu/Zn efflux transporter [uncultured Amphritea sp.]